MKIEYNLDFQRHFGTIWDYISQDSTNRANLFKTNLKLKIENLKYNPYKFRQSFYYEDENIRDMIFKGYTIIYLIDNQVKIIVILDIFKWQDR